MAQIGHMGPPQPPIRRVQEAASSGLKQKRRENNHSLLNSDEVKGTWMYTSTSLYVFKAQCLVKHRAKFKL
jgi:hypothetical protein